MLSNRKKKQKLLRLLPVVQPAATWVAESAERRISAVLCGFRSVLTKSLITAAGELNTPNVVFKPLKVSVPCEAKRLTDTKITQKLVDAPCLRPKHFASGHGGLNLEIMLAHLDAAFRWNVTNWVWVHEFRCIHISKIWAIGTMTPEGLLMENHYLPFHTPIACRVNLL